MSVLERLTKIYKTSKVIDFDDSSKIVLMSDCHRGDGSWADDLARNENVYYSALKYYYTNDYLYIELGDGDELWENKDFSVITEAHKDTFRLLQKFHLQKRLYMIFGNHDMVKKDKEFANKELSCHFDAHFKKSLPLFKNVHPYEALVLHYSNIGNKIFLLHGHQADFFNDRLWKISKFLVRHVWRRLDALGYNDPTSAAKNNKKKSSVELLLIKWARKEKQMLIAGHTHRPMFPEIGEPLYFNDGSCVHPRCITAVEMTEGNITLVKWCIRTNRDGMLYVKKEVLAGPEKIQNFFSAIK